MADATLVLKADNSQYIQKVTQAAQVTQKLHDTAVSGGKREKGILEEIDATLVKLEKSKRKAFTYEDIEKYNKKIAETKQNLKEYEEAGLKATKETESLTQSIGKWAAGLGIAVTALNLLKTALKDTIGGMYIFNAAGAAMNQVLYNIVTGVGNWNKGVAESIALAKQRTDLLLKDRMEMIKSKELMREYNKLYTESIENADDGAKKIDALTKAKEKYQAAVQIEIDSTKEQLGLALRALRLAPESDSAQLQVAELYGKLQDLLGAQESGIRRISRQIATEQVKLFTDVITAAQNSQEEIQKILDDIYKEEAEKDEERKKENERLDKEFAEGKKAFEKKQRDERERQGVAEMQRLAKDYKDKTKLAEDKVDEQIAIEKKYYDWFWDQSEKQRRKDQQDAEDKKQYEDDLWNYKRQLMENAAGLGAELFNRQFAKLEANYNRDIKAAKDNESLKYKIDEEYRKKKNELLKKSSIAEKIAGLFSVGISTAKGIADAGSKVITIPLIPWILANGLVQAAIIAAKPIPQFAKGGWTGNGTYKDSTGERVAGVVHEKEFVVKRGPAYKFREVLDAINKDDRSLVINRFNRLAPEIGGTVNNVLVENTGPNKRLDQLIQENKKLNAKLSGESIQSFGNVQVIRKGSTTRTVRT